MSVRTAFSASSLEGRTIWGPRPISDWGLAGAFFTVASIKGSSLSKRAKSWAVLHRSHRSIPRSPSGGLKFALVSGKTQRRCIYYAYSLAARRGVQPNLKSMSLPDDIYSQRILELAASIPRTERLQDPDASALAHSKLCGSKVTVDLKMQGDEVTHYGQTVRACLLGQTSASIMGREIVGSKADELRAVGAAMRKMLKEGGPAPSGRWADLAVLEPVRDYRARHASTLLVFDAVEDAIAQIEAKRRHEAEPAFAAT